MIGDGFFGMDSSFFIDATRADAYARHLKTWQKWLLRPLFFTKFTKNPERTDRGRSSFRCIAHKRTSVIPLSESIALFAADLSILHSLQWQMRLSMQQQSKKAVKVVTGDAHFKGLGNVLFIE